MLISTFNEQTLNINIVRPTRYRTQHFFNNVCVSQQLGAL